MSTTDWMADDDANEHIANLVKLRDRLIEERRAQVAKTAVSDEAGDVSPAEYKKVRDLQAQIEEVKKLLGEEKLIVWSEKSRVDGEERSRFLQEQHRARYPNAYPQDATAE